MADNVAVRKGVVVKTDEMADHSHIQYVKLDMGAAGLSDPVEGTVPISATSLPLPDGGATAAAQATLLTELQAKTEPADQQHVIVDSSATVAVTGPLTDAQLRAANVDTQYGDSMNLDAFSRLRVSAPVGLFDVQSQYDANPFRMETGASGTGSAGAHSAATRMVALACTAGTGTSFLQSYEYVPYQPGKSQLVLVTGLLGTAAADAIVDVGLFDAANGIFLRQNGTDGLQLVRRTSTGGGVANNTVEQAAWNLDPLNGNGPSGVTLGVTTVFILVIDAQFLGMGRVRVGFDIGGVIIPVHEFLHANVLAVPYMQTLTLPIGMLVTTGSAAKTAYFKCASVSSEGGFEQPGTFTYATPEQTVTAGNGTATHLLSMRPALTFNSITNRARISLSSVEILVTGNTPILWQLCIGSTFSAAPTFANVAGSAVDATTAVGTMSAVGTVIAAGYVSASAQTKGAISSQVAGRYPITLDRAGAVRASGTYSLHVTGLGATSACRALFNFTEQR